MARIFIVSGPSGSGKGTILTEAKKLMGDFFVSVSMTTRAPRPGEIADVSYHYVTKDVFKDAVDNNNMLEYSEYCGEYYGTPYIPAKKAMDEGKNVILEIELNGMRQVKKRLPDAVTIFISPPSMEILEKRLRARDPNEKKIDQRLAKAKSEMDCANEYDYVVVNNDLDDAVADFMKIYNSESAK